MEPINVNLSCDIQQPVKVRYLDGYFFRKDSAGHRINVDVFDNGVPVSVGGSVSAEVVRSDGETVPVTGAVSENRAYVILPQAAYAVVGAVQITIKVTEGTTIVTIACFVAYVHESDTDITVDPGTIIPSIQALISQIETAVASIPADYSSLWTSLAPAFSTSTAYAVGQYVTNSGVLYRFTTAHPAGTWNSAHVTAVNLGSDISALKSAFEDDINGITGAKPIIFEVGYWSTPAVGSAVTKSDNAGYRTARFPVSVGNKITINLSGGSGSQRAYVWIDSSGNVLSRSGTDVSGKQTITAPTGAVECAINNRLALQTDGYYAFYGESIPDALAKKQDTLTFDDLPTEDSTNPVESGGVYSEIKTIKDVIGEQQTKVTGSADVDYYWNSESTTAVKTAYSSYKAYDAIAVTPGDKMRLTCSYSASSSKQWPFLFVDDNLTIIGHEGTRSTTNIDLTVTVPAGATKLLMTCGKYQLCGAYVVTLKPIPDNSFSGTFDYKGKNVAIIGDSISTNGDYSETNPLGNVPEIIVTDEDIGVELSAYVTYYDVGTTIGGHTIVESEVGTELTFTPVDGDQGKIIGKPKNNNTATTDVWWEVAAAVLGFNPIPVCWSGSSITDHEENVQDDGHYIYKCAHSFHPSQIRKCGIRTPGAMTRTAPDMIIIYRGTNDLTHSPYSRLTDDLDSFPTTYPDADTFDDGGTTRYSFVKGMRLLIKKLHDAYPETKIVLCTLNYFRRLSHTAIYTSNGYNNWLEYNAMIRRIADYEGCSLIEFDKDGLNYWNATNGYYNEGTSDTAYWTHPNTKGQARLGSRALVDLRKVNDMTVPT